MVVITVKINDSEAKYCIYCKQLLINESEIKLQHHIACAQDVKTFNKNSTQVFKKIKHAFRITNLETENEGFPEQGICKFKFNDHGVCA